MRQPMRSRPVPETAAGSELVCPAPSCHAVLVCQSESPLLTCPRCTRTYPLIAGLLPVVVPEPARHLAAEAIRLRKDIAWFREQGALLSAGQRRFPSRAPSQERMRTALARTGELLDEILTAIVPQLDPRALLDVATRPAEPTAYGARRLCSLLRRDFGGEIESERELGALVGAVREETRRARARTDRMLVLGCGVGRLAEEFASFGSEVSAIDLSPVLLMAAQLLQEQPLELCDLQSRNARSAASQARLFTARRPASRAAVAYSVADATAMPFADGSWPTIVSVYFTDVVPLSRLLPEVWRVLEPGGHLLHVGPLGYHFDDLAEHYAADELLEHLQSSGFGVTPPRWIPSTHNRAEGSLYTASFDNLVFTARRTETSFVVEPPAPPFIAARRS
jgi:SAM-dependent methyltransferase/uncharacterized protein YbaR (Trm112 family)